MSTLVGSNLFDNILQAQAYTLLAGPFTTDHALSAPSEDYILGTIIIIII